MEKSWTSGGFSTQNLEKWQMANRKIAGASVAVDKHCDLWMVKTRFFCFFFLNFLLFFETIKTNFGAPEVLYTEIDHLGSSLIDIGDVKVVISQQFDSPKIGLL